MDMSNFIEAHWHKVKGKIREEFGELTDDDELEIAGKVEQLVGKLQERYNISTEEAEARVSGLHLDAAGLELELEGSGDSTDVTSADVEDMKREQQERTEKYINRS